MFFLKKKITQNASIVLLKDGNVKRIIEEQKENCGPVIFTVNHKKFNQLTSLFLYISGFFSVWIAI